MTSVPNVQLEDMLRRAGLSHGAAARHLNARARAAGVNMATDTTRVSRWVKGEHPRHPVPELLLALLAERLDVSLTLADIGMTHTGSDPLHPSWPPRDIADSLHQFTGSDMLTRRDLMDLVVGTSLAATAERLWQIAPVQAATAGRSRVGEPEVAALEELGRYLRTLDDAHGGALRVTVGHLDTVAGLLKARHPPAIERRLYAVSTDAAMLAGWTSHDAGLYATAQRYWAYAISLARANHDPGRGAEAMTRMSHQMICLGRCTDALQLLDVAARTAPASGNLRVQSMISAQRGRVHAALGHGPECQADLDRAELQLEHARDSAEPIPGWIAYYTPAELAGAVATSRRDLALLHAIDIGPASAAFTSALALRGPGYDRVHAMDLVGLAAAHLDEGNPEHAYAVAGQALDAAERLHSRLIHARVLTLVQAAGRHASHPQAADLLERIRPWQNSGVQPA